MKAQKLGLVLGMNMAVACMMMQGCKANKAQSDLPPDTTTVVATAPADATAATTAPADVAADVAVDTPAPAVDNSAAGAAPTASSGVVIEKPTYVETPPAPSRVPTVGKLPPVGSKPVATTKPVATGSSAGTAPTVSAPADTGFVYTVKPGDQLFAVSRKYNVRMDAIKRANPGLNPDKIRIGQKITIPGVTGPAATVAGTSAAAGTARTMQASATVPAANTTAPVKTKPAFKAYTGPTKEYVVKSGDSLGKLAYDSGITIRALQELNGMAKDKVGLRIGQKLLIPAEKVVAETKAAPAVKTSEAPKTVAKGAEKKVEPAAEAKVEEKKAEAVAAPEVKAPEAKAEAPAAVEEKKAETPDPEAGKVDEPAVETPAPAPAASGNTYTVKEGDDLVSVSITWGISPSQLMDLNGLKAGDAIKPGQVLKLPANAKAVQ